MACMLMLSRHSAILFGGIGVTTLTVGDGTMVGDGIVLTMAGDITRVHGAAGMVATGVASMAAVAIGDIITTGVVVLAGAVEAAAIGLATHIQIVVHMLLIGLSLPLVVQIITVHRLVEQQV